MNRFRLLLACLCALLSVTDAGAQPFGLSNRLANTTLAMPQQPQTFGFALQGAFPVMFTNPIAVTSPPGETNRLFIVERAGRVVAITNLAAPDRTVVLDLNTLSNKVATDSECGLLGMAFHPNFSSNRYFFLFYTHTNMTTSSTGRHQRIVRFQMSDTNNNFVDITNEVALVSQFDQAGNHNGGDLHFGPDGYLYASFGDEGNQADTLNNSQTIRKDFFSGIIRIDVDKKPGNLAPNPHAAHIGQTNYSVPADNPWVAGPPATDTNATGQVRTEFYAMGLRNPWRFSFDELTGQLWVGDVGGTNETAREEVDIIVKGGNYGWAFREGIENGPKAAQAPGGFTFVPPITYYLHSGGPSPANLSGNSVTGGFVYRGDRISSLFGKYIFCDYASGYLWALTPDGTNYVTMTNVQQVVNSGGIVAFAPDPRNGDVLVAYVAQSGTNSVRRLIYNSTPTGTPLPATLSATGAFTNLTTLTPHAGIVPYSLNVPFWSDNAIKTRWFSLPDTNLTVTWNPTSNWSFPTGAVWIKHFDLVTNYVSGQSTRLETRFIVRNSNGAYGATYRWGGAADATLVAEGGSNETFVITDPGGVLRTQLWHYPSRSECLTCHNDVAGLALGFHTAQLNRSHAYTNFANATGVTDNQLRALNNAGYLSPSLTGLNSLPALANWNDTTVSLEWRVRSYVAANCVQCHQPGGLGLGTWDGRHYLSTAAAGLINGTLVNNQGNTNARVIVPSSLPNSMLYQRIAGLAGTRMPPLATSVLDANNMNLVAEWIGALSGHQTFADWQNSNFGFTNGTAAADFDADGDTLANYLEYLIGANPKEASSDWKVNIRLNGSNPQVVFPHLANRGFEVQFRPGFGAPAPWLPLDVPGNAPFFPAATFTNVVEDTTGTVSNKSYRVRVFAP